MNLTFKEFVQKKCDLLDPNAWSTQKKEHQLVAINNELMRRHFYQELPHVSSYMEENCELKGFAYQFHFTHEIFERDTYHFVFCVEQEIHAFELVMHANGELQSSSTLFHKLDDEYFDVEYDTDLDIPSGLKKAAVDFQQAVYDLPKFRLYAVTGILGKDETN